MMVWNCKMVTQAPLAPTGLRIRTFLFWLVQTSFARSKTSSRRTRKKSIWQVQGSTLKPFNTVMYLITSPNPSKFITLVAIPKLFWLQASKTQKSLFHKLLFKMQTLYPKICLWINLNLQLLSWSMMFVLNDKVYKRFNVFAKLMEIISLISKLNNNRSTHNYKSTKHEIKRNWITNWQKMYNFNRK